MSAAKKPAAKAKVRQQKLNKSDLKPAELEKFSKTLWPAKPVTIVAELKQLLDCQFYTYGENDDDNDDDDDDDEDDDREDSDKQWANFSAFTRKVGGFSWLNALHQFDDDEEEPCDTPLTYILSRDPDEWRFVGFLLQMGADVNVRDGRGQPPLFLFVNGGMGKRYRTFDALLESGANDKAVYAGMTMIQFAHRMKGNEGVNALIWDHFRGKYNITDKDMKVKRKRRRSSGGSSSGSFSD